MTALLDVQDLTVRLDGPGGRLVAVGGVSLRVAPGETVAGSPARALSRP